MLYKIRFLDLKKRKCFKKLEYKKNFPKFITLFYIEATKIFTFFCLKDKINEK